MAGLSIGALHLLAKERARVLLGTYPVDQVVFAQLLERQVADVLVDPVGHEAAGDAPVIPLGERISSSQACQIFHSLWISWSSKIIEVETVENSQRKTGSPHPSR